MNYSTMSDDWWQKYEIPISVPPEIDIRIEEEWTWAGHHNDKIATYQLYDYKENTWRSLYVIFDGTIESVDFREDFIGSIPFLEAKGRIIQHIRECAEK